LSKATLYNYFEDKDDLLQFLYGRIVEPFFEAMEDIARAELSVPEKLEKILRAALEKSDKHKAIIKLLAETNREFYEIKNETRPRLLGLLVRIYEQGIAEGDFLPHNPVHSAHLLLGCLTELFEWQKYGATNEEAAEYVTALIAVAANGFSIHVKERVQCK
jgi:AcrR family transcriptional regulator